tara:strand:- start:818 stop:1048 length:231 start_codon:yes stop_codon:yes gene_type:complete
MYIYKKLILVTNNSSWWKQIKYRRESAKHLLKERSLGWKYIKKELIKKNSSYKDTRTFYTYYLKKKAEKIISADSC